MEPPPQIAGFMPNDQAMAGRISAARPSAASLFVWGATDQLVPSERSVQLMDSFGGPTEAFEHPGAHMVRLWRRRTDVFRVLSCVWTSMATDDKWNRPSHDAQVPSCTGDFKRRLISLLDQSQPADDTTCQ